MAARSLVAAAALLAATLPALAQPAEASAAQRLLERLERLEQRNRELEARLKALEGEQQRSEAALASERLSEKEPELVTRLKAVEFQTLEMQKQARQIHALEGVGVSASLTGVLQQVQPGLSAEGRRQSRASYRGDVAVTLPGGSLGNADGHALVQFRLGQGSGVALRPTYTSTVNSIAFETGAGPDDSFAILAQAWYQLDVPLPLDGLKERSLRRLELNLGKIDPFVFFDQNTIADDETTRFMNNALVHNPLLDSGGDVGADAYGFSPGARLAYVDASDRTQPWGVSVGVFGSGPAANFSGSLSGPFVIAQIEATRRFSAGLVGNYRLYAWRNGRAAGLDGEPQRHAGWGASIDQRVSDHVTLFTRFGRQASGEVRFDRVLTLGLEADGGLWGRAADAVGLGLGRLHSRRADPAGRAEELAELYYRMRLNERIELSPDLQWIGRPAGERSASGGWAFGLRFKLSL